MGSTPAWNPDPATLKPVSTAPASASGWNPDPSTLKPVSGGANASQPDTGVLAGIKRNTVGMVAGIYHAFTDPPTAQEKADLMQKVQDEKDWQKAHGYDPNDVPESLATNPSTVTLAYHRLVDAPADQLSARGTNEVAAAKDLMSKGNITAGALGYLNGRADQGLATIPMAGPWVNSVADRAQSGDISGAATDIAAAVALQNAPGIAKTAKKVLNTPLVDAVRDAAAQQMAGPVVRKTPTATMNDLKFGRNPAEAITKEPGLEGVTVSGLRDGVAQRMNEIGQVMDQTLQSAPGRNQIIDTEPIISQAAADAKNTPLAKLNPGLSDRIDSLSDALKTQFGSLQKNPLEATQFKRDVGEAAKWTGQPFDNEANQFLVQVYRGVKDEVNAAVPEVQPLNERYADLLSAKAALDRRIAYNVNRPWSAGRALLGAGGGALGTVAGGTAGGPIGAAAGLGLDLLRSDPARIAAGKILGAKYQLPQGAPAPPPGTPTGALSPLLTPVLIGANAGLPPRLLGGNQ